MYHVGAQGVDERMINVHYYYCLDDFFSFSCHNPCLPRIYLLARFQEDSNKIERDMIQTHKRLKRKEKKEKGLTDEGSASRI